MHTAFRKRGHYGGESDAVSVLDTFGSRQPFINWPLMKGDSTSIFGGAPSSGRHGRIPADPSESEAPRANTIHYMPVKSPRQKLHLHSAV